MNELGMSFIVVIVSVFVIGAVALPENLFAFLTCLASFLSLAGPLFAGFCLGFF
jgi:hypothetical protein